MEITTKHCHEFFMLMWVHHIIALHWGNVLVKRGEEKIIILRKILFVLSKKKAADSNIRMKHINDSCYMDIPYV